MKIQNIAFVVFNHGAFGGAPKRYTLLFSYLSKKYPGQFYYIINNHLYNQIKEIFADFDFTNVRIVDLKPTLNAHNIADDTKARYYPDHIPDPLDIDKNTSYARKVFWYWKNYFRQKKLYRQIESLRKELSINVFLGVFGGIVPLTFYMNEMPRKAAVIFSDMDSWFVDVHRDMKKLWYRKFYSFNYAFENADIIDFLSPFIYDGIIQRGLKIKEDRVSIAPCSFTDYSKCGVGDKSKIEVAFAARLEPDKNPLLFLEAAKLIHNEFPDVKFHLLGEGTLVHEAEMFIEKNDLSNTVEFRFHKNPPEVFAGTSIFVSLQTGTNYPSQSILEAMACGNAIIASNTGDTYLFINDSNGILIDLTLDQLVNALKKLISEPRLAASLGKNGREFALNNHTIERAELYYMGLFNRAANLR